MTADFDPAPPPAPRPDETPRRRSVGRFLFRTAIGWTLVVLVLLLAVVLLLPTLGSGFAKSKAESFVHDRYRGALQVGKLDLAWFSDQRVEDAVLVDPDGKRVARASVTLPSLLHLLRSGGTRIGTVLVDLDADLVADDAGVTNLQKALAPRAPAETKPAEPAPKDRKDLFEKLAELDVDVRVASKRITWSDVDTRQLGRPLELRDLAMQATARPGAPMQVSAKAEVAGEEPGVLDVAGKVNGPIRPGEAWPFGSIEGRGDVRKFPSAMLDGLLGQKGKLKEVLGATFDATFSATDVTPDRGAVTATLTSSGARVELAGRFEGGKLHAQGERFLDAQVALPRGYLAQYVVPRLPPGSKLDFGADAKPWQVRIDALELPVPDPKHLDLAGLEPVLAATTCRASIAMPSAIGFENEETRRAFGHACALEGTTVDLAIAPKEAPRVAVRSTLVAQGRTPIELDASSKDVWRALASGTTPHVDALVDLRDVPTAVLDAALGLEGKLAAGLGDAMHVKLEARDAGRDRGSVTIAVDAPRVKLDAPLELANGKLTTAAGKTIEARLDAPAGWIETWLPAGSVPASVKLSTSDGRIVVRAKDVALPLPDPNGPRDPADPLAFLRGATRADVHVELPAMRARITPVSEGPGEVADVRLEHAMLDATLAENGSAKIVVEGAVDAGSPGRVNARAEIGDAWAVLPRKGSAFVLPPVEIVADVSGVAPELAELVAPAPASGASRSLGARARSLLGGPFAVHVEAHDLTMERGALRASVDAPALGLDFSGRVEGGHLRCAGPEGLAISASPPSEALASELAAFLPGGARVTLSNRRDAIRVEVRDVDVELPKPAPAPTAASTGPSEGLSPATLRMLETARGRVEVKLASATYVDASDAKARTELSVQDLALTAALDPGQPLTAKLDAALTGGEHGAVHADVRLADPWFALRGPDAKKDDASTSKSAPIDARLQVTGLSTRLFDSLASDPGLVSKLLGPAVDLDARVTGATTPAPFAGDVAVTLDSTTTKARVAGTVKDGAFVATGDRGVELAIRLPNGWLEGQISPKLPAGAKLSVPTEAEPLTLKVASLRVPLPKPAAVAKAKDAVAKKDAATPASAEGPSLASVLALVADVSMKAELGVPELVYSDATTGPAQPIAIRGLKAAVDVAPDAPPSIRVAASLAGEATPTPVSDGNAAAPATPSGSAFTADVRALDPLRTLGEQGGLDRFRVACDVSAKGVPTALVDALARQDGLLVEALGGRVDLSAKSAGISMQKGAVVADLASELHKVHCEGEIENRTFRVTKQDGLDAKVGLGPVMNKRVVGKLVPMLVDLKKPEGAAPASFAVDHLSMPFDGNLRELDADVRVDLGEVSYALLPGLDKLFGSAFEMKATKLPALSIPIRKGVASYKGLSIEIAGAPCLFDGSFDLAALTLQLDAKVPLKVLGKSIDKTLDKAREYVDPELAVPIEIRGAWNKPKVSIRSDFLKGLVEDAAKRGIGDLLEGFLKKKKD